MNAQPAYGMNGNGLLRNNNFAQFQYRRACIMSAGMFLVSGLFALIPTIVASAIETPAIGALILLVYAFTTGITGVIIFFKTAPQSHIQNLTSGHSNLPEPSSSSPNPSNPPEVPQSILIYSWMVKILPAFAAGSIIFGIVTIATSTRFDSFSGAVSIVLGILFLIASSIQIFHLQAAFRTIGNTSGGYMTPTSGSNAPIVVGGYHPTSGSTTGFTQNQFANPTSGSIGFPQNQFGGPMMANQGTTSGPSGYLPYPSQNEISHMTNQNQIIVPDAPPSYADVVIPGDQDLKKDKF